MLKKSLLFSLFLLTSILIFSQATENNLLKISGFIQTQWQLGELDSLKSKPFDFKVGQGPSASEKNNSEYINRLGVRRARIKFTHQYKSSESVIQLDMTEKGVVLKDAYTQFPLSKNNLIALKTGVFNRPFGYEIGISSKDRESPERSRITQTLFPNNRDIGGTFILSPQHNDFLKRMKLHAGLFSGSGTAADNDNVKDFIGSLSYISHSTNYSYGLGFSALRGFISQPTKTIYAINKNGYYQIDSTGYSNRNYWGCNLQYEFKSDIGTTAIKTEEMWGIQPGSNKSTFSPSTKGYYPGGDTIKTDTYLRPFQGGNISLTHTLLNTKHLFVCRYDWYDPNTLVSGKEIGNINHTTKADLFYQTLGFGYIYNLNKNLRFTLYEDISLNESTAISGYTNDLHDNTTTIRIQYKF